LAQPSGAWTTGFTYDAAHRLATVLSPAGTFTCTYKGPGNLVTNLALPNTLRITNALDTVGRLTSTRLLTSGSSLLNAHADLYNLASQRTNQTRTDASTVTYEKPSLSHGRRLTTLLRTIDPRLTTSSGPEGRVTTWYAHQP